MAEDQAQEELRPPQVRSTRCVNDRIGGGSFRVESAEGARVEAAVPISESKSAEVEVDNHEPDPVDAGR
jgi:hypothetical protein